MTFSLIRASAFADASDDIHIARILLLLRAASDKKSTKTIKGITKLAKLDFLLRYPNCLERSLEATGKKLGKINISFNKYETKSIESKMIRFRYGPWDSRYRKWIGVLMAKDLAISFILGNTVCIEITEKGKEISDMLSSLEEYSVMSDRCTAIVKTFGTYSATKLMDFVYDTFPELSSMKWGEKITL